MYQLSITLIKTSKNHYTNKQIYLIIYELKWTSFSMSVGGARKSFVAKNKFDLMISMAD